MALRSTTVWPSGANTIIGSGSMVTRPVPANVVAVGPPARVLCEITDADKTGYRL